MNIVKSVLVFDSGVGGLSVYKEITFMLPEQHIIYAFDNEAFPYGELADDVLIHRVCHMVCAICEEREVALVVIACNTASTIVLSPLRELLSIPVVGVVPAIKPAARLTKKKAIGLLATPATIKRDYTSQLVKNFALGSSVKMVGSTELVEMAEDKLRGLAVNSLLLEKILQPFVNEVDCLVLGCTHFPLLKEEIMCVLGESCFIIDSGKAVAERVVWLLSENSPIILDQKWQYHDVLSSAPVKNELALNIKLSQLGFSAIKRSPHF